MSAPRDAATASYKMNHTMLRVKDPKKSIAFYRDILGMDLIDEHKGGDFTLYFLGYDHSNGKDSADDKRKNRSTREALIELTHNHGTENDPDFKGYANGNSDPGRGFGHIAISVEDIEGACQRLEDLGVEFQKKLTDGKMKNIAFAKDPDGYWVEIIPARTRD